MLPFTEKYTYLAYYKNYILASYNCSSLKKKQKNFYDQGEAHKNLICYFRTVKCIFFGYQKNNITIVPILRITLEP